MLRTMMDHPMALYRLARELARYHAEIHRIAAPELPSLHDEAQRIIPILEDLDQRTRGRLLDSLPSLPSGDRLCHLDYHPGNVLFSTDQRCYVVDWPNACRADPSADVARTISMLSFGEPSNVTPLEALTIKLGRSVVRHLYFKEYLRQSGKARVDVTRWLTLVTALRLNETIPRSERISIVNFVHDRLGRG